MPGACDLQGDLVGCIDAARQIIDDLGLRPEFVEIMTVSWGGLPGLGLPDNGLQFGAGTGTQVSRVVITPQPEVSAPHPRLVAANPGRYEDGDRMISKVTRTLLEADLIQPPDGGGGEKVERYFLIDGDPYRMVREPEKQNFEWIIHTRRMRDRPAVVVP